MAKRYNGGFISAVWTPLALHGDLNYWWSWGRNINGAVGDGTTINRSSPVQIGTLSNWSIIAVAGYHTAALKTDGTMWTWGNNAQGRLGDNTVVYKSSPVQVGALTTWSKIAPGTHKTAFGMAVKTDGTMWTWGYAGFGQLGDVTVYNKSSPIQIGSLTNWSLVAAGGYHSLAIKTNGTLWAWGRATHGQLGYEEALNQFPSGTSSPVQIGALTTWSKIDGGTYNSMALKTDGTMWLWGFGNYGILGQNNQVYKSSPVQLGALTTWSKIAMCGINDSGHVLAIKTDGTLWAWGASNRGQVGDNTTIFRSSPVQIGALTTWSQIGAGGNHSVAIASIPF